MKKAIVLAGVSGTGKTHARLNDPELKGLPCMDVADYHRKYPELEWFVIRGMMYRKVLELSRTPEAIMIEGYFLPNIESRISLETMLRVRGIKPEFRDLWAPFEVCQERIAGQFERNEISASECRTRIGMLKIYWTPAPPGVEG